MLIVSHVPEKTFGKKMGAPGIWKKRGKNPSAMPARLGKTQAFAGREGEVNLTRKK